VDAVTGEVLDKGSYGTIACALPNNGLHQTSARLVATRRATASELLSQVNACGQRGRRLRWWSAVVRC
jgi:hypothetical protein